MDGLYVTEVGARVAIHGSSRVREPLSRPSAVGVTRGFWEFWYRPDDLGTDRPTGALFTFEYTAPDLDHAEDIALAVARRLTTLFAFYSGGPDAPPELVRIAGVDVSGSLKGQWNYYYDLREPASIGIVPSRATAFLDRMLSTDPDLLPQIESAIRWLVRARTSASSSDAFLAAWIGFEAIGARLGDLFHPNGARARCDVCQNTAGEKRDAGMAGIEHALKLFVPNVIDVASFERLALVRNSVAHGMPRQTRSQQASLTEEEVREIADRVQSDIGYALGKSILVSRDGLPTSKDELAFGWESALPRDYSIRPDVRVEIIPREILPDHKPFQKGWIEVERDIDVTRSSVDDDGVYTRESTQRIRTGYWLKVDQEKPAMRVTKFLRPGVNMYLTLEEGEADPEEQSWREFRLPEAWQREREAANDEDDSRGFRGRLR